MSLASAITLSSLELTRFFFAVPLLDRACSQLEPFGSLLRKEVLPLVW